MVFEGKVLQHGTFPALWGPSVTAGYEELAEKRGDGAMVDKSLRLLDNSALNEELPPQPDMTLHVPWIPEDSLSLQSEWRHLGDGDFTRVYAADLKKRVDQRTCRQRVAVKRPKQDASRIIQEKFSKSVDRMSSWVHSHIIKFEGIGAGYMMVMEYASQGPLDKYLRALMEHGGSGMTLTEQLLAATQLIRALEYLESRRIVHGNVSAHNTLVVRGTPDLHIKLGDPMFSIYYHSLHQNERAKLKRVRWTAPELLATNSEPTLAGDIFSYAITLWEIMSHGAIPLASLPSERVRDHYSHGIRLEKPPDCPDSVFRIMEQCWCHEARNRPPCRGVLRDIYTNLYGESLTGM
ncbi:megakaryocyte-associated tyrosine-protein kinase-like [Diadema setosum]|uniref:megakaryocyte-associated tyrosine-protein kinase-like n=1 Tax=Diadema setosum TaxID=31175 RepID=UPI003B3AF984